VENAAYVHPHEVAALARRWPTYRGREIGTDNIRAWYEQVDENQQQRLLFKLLQNVRIFSDLQIREKLKTIHHSSIRPLLPEFVIRRRSDRRTDVVVTYVDGEAKSGQFYASRYATVNAIHPSSVISPVEFSKSLGSYVVKYGIVSAIVVVDDIIATGRSLAGNVSNFLSKNARVLQKQNVPIILVALAATPDGEAYVRTEVEKIEWADFDLGIGDLLSDQDFAFSGNGIWKDPDELARAKALCSDICSCIYRDSPLGYGGQGLLVVFPDTCPNNSLPILHSQAHPASKRKWNPLFPRLVD